MTILAEVIDETEDTYSPPGKPDILSWKYILLDKSEGVRCKTMMELNVPRKAGEKAMGLREKYVHLSINEIGKPFGGCIRVRGTIAVPAEAPSSV